MKFKKKKLRENELRPCRNCGGTVFYSEYPVTASPNGFIHIRLRCKQCGEWHGGYTRKKQTKED